MPPDSSSDEDPSEDEKEVVAQQLHEGTFTNFFSPPSKRKLKLDLETQIGNFKRDLKEPRCPFCLKKSMKHLKALEDHASTFNGDSKDRMTKRHRGLGLLLERERKEREEASRGSASG
eukprot:CAMPEP_0198216550 /NCGR_PEP_ID=MMETSP1445-20131203/58344_1 /TAXON_ID=36898 /ORGANISM="Pyramimonas sp., Strain CCMP2087" /LENGTH=117 /DNA_ID=CAMNT_0043892845 /DNA_START=145 /DNA_END=494 /DNA_ORIENTATION=+